MVQHPDIVEIVLLAILVGVPPDAQEEGDGAAMAGEAAFPGHEDFPEALPTAQIIVWLIEEAVPQTGAYDGADKKHIQHGIQEALADFFPTDETAHDVPAQDEPADKQDRIPPELNAAKVEDDGVYVPIDYQIFHRPQR